MVSNSQSTDKSNNLFTSTSALPFQGLKTVLAYEKSPCSRVFALPHTSPTTRGGIRCPKPHLGRVVLSSTVHREYCLGVEEASLNAGWQNGPVLGAESIPLWGGPVLEVTSCSLTPAGSTKKCPGGILLLLITWLFDMHKYYNIGMDLPCIPQIPPRYTAASVLQLLIPNACHCTHYSAHTYLLHFHFIPSVTLSSRPPCN